MKEQDSNSLQEEILQEREAELARREAELEAKEKRLQENKDLNAKEGFYENFRKVPVRYLDYLIGACAVAIVVCVVLGMLKGRAII